MSHCLLDIWHHTTYWIHNRGPSIQCQFHICFIQKRWLCSWCHMSASEQYRVLFNSFIYFSYQQLPAIVNASSHVVSHPECVSYFYYFILCIFPGSFHCNIIKQFWCLQSFHLSWPTQEETLCCPKVKQSWWQWSYHSTTKAKAT